MRYLLPVSGSMRSDCGLGPTDNGSVRTALVCPSVPMDSVRRADRPSGTGTPSRVERRRQATA